MAIYVHSLHLHAYAQFGMIPFARDSDQHVNSLVRRKVAILYNRGLYKRN